MFGTWENVFVPVSGAIITEGRVESATQKSIANMQCTLLFVCERSALVRHGIIDESVRIFRSVVGIVVPLLKAQVLAKA